VAENKFWLSQCQTSEMDYDALVELLQGFMKLRLKQVESTDDKLGLQLLHGAERDLKKVIDVFDSNQPWKKLLSKLRETGDENFAHFSIFSIAWQTRVGTEMKHAILSEGFQRIFEFEYARKTLGYLFVFDNEDRKMVDMFEKETPSFSNLLEGSQIKMIRELETRLSAITNRDDASQQLLDQGESI
jgi:hypothetical protein